VAWAAAAWAAAAWAVVAWEAATNDHSLCSQLASMATFRSYEGDPPLEIGRSRARARHGASVARRSSRERRRARRRCSMRRREKSGRWSAAVRFCSPMLASNDASTVSLPPGCDAREPMPGPRPTPPLDPHTAASAAIVPTATSVTSVGAVDAPQALPAATSLFAGRLTVDVRPPGLAHDSVCRLAHVLSPQPLLRAPQTSASPSTDLPVPLRSSPRLQAVEEQDYPGAPTLMTAESRRSGCRGGARNGVRAWHGARMHTLGARALVERGSTSWKARR